MFKRFSAPVQLRRGQEAQHFMDHAHMWGFLLQSGLVHVVSVIAIPLVPTHLTLDMRYNCSSDQLIDKIISQPIKYG